MAKVHDSITEHIQEFIAKQHLFFVSTAPLSADGHVNLSPKGMDCFRVLSPHRVAYADVIGSGNETSAHLLENGRITIMFCNFEQPALILRIYGRGRSVLPQDAGWAALAPKFTLLPGTRQIFLIDVESVQTSCGWGVPFMAFDRERDTLTKYHRQADPAAWVTKVSGRTRSIDGLPTRATDRFIAGEEVPPG